MLSTSPFLYQSCRNGMKRSINGCFIKEIMKSLQVVILRMRNLSLNLLLTINNSIAFVRKKQALRIQCLLCYTLNKLYCALHDKVERKKYLDHRSFHKNDRTFYCHAS